ncbi:hypothetical protein ACIP5L_33245 [Streptomyces bacillaris]|uniref:hypothetical protein n=1 Tax=Streptomyces bacillaris TaxID=68179 RepID=UPI003830135C
MVFLASVLGAAAQPVAVAYLVLVDGVGSDDLVVLAALLSMASLFAWFFVRVGIQPLIVVEGDTVVVHNPLLSYQAPLPQTKFLATGGKFALRLEGVGHVRPWVLSRSVFDGDRARSARRECRELIQEARLGRTDESATSPESPESPESVRADAEWWMRVGAAEALLLLPLAFLIWNVIDMASGN